MESEEEGKGRGGGRLIANSGSEKIGNGRVAEEDLLEEVKGLKVGRSEWELGESDWNRRDRRDENEARREGGRLLLSTTKPTGDRV